MDRVEVIMKTLDLTREQALELLEDDKRIDRGEKMDFDLAPEEEKNAKKYTRADTKKHAASGKKPREDDEKTAIIEQLFEFLSENSYENVEILNKSQKIGFKLGENSFSLTLTRHRK